jgi:hypothetical protein
MRAIRKGDDSDMASADDLELVPGASNTTEAEEAEEQRKLLRASFIAKTMTVILTLGLLVLWPMPMYGTGYIFSEKFFTGWVVVGIMWLFFSVFCVGLYPIFEGRHSLNHNIRAIYRDITGKEHPSKHHGSQATYVEGKDGGDTGVATPEQGNEKEITEKTTVNAE